MKKIMVALAAVAFAAVAQAAVVNWQVGSFTGPGADGKGWGADLIGGEGYVAQLLVSATYADGALGDLITFTEGDTLGADDIADGYGWGTTSNSLANDTVYYGQLIVTKGDSTLTSQIVSFETSGLTESADISFALADEVYGLDAAEGSLDPVYGTFTSAGWAAESIPEPTSGLLLLLGMAGLALKRKVA